MCDSVTSLRVCVCVCVCASVCVCLSRWSLSRVSVATTQHSETIRGWPTQRGERTLTQEPRVRGHRKGGREGGREEGKERERERERESEGEREGVSVTPCIVFRYPTFSIISVYFHLVAKV